MGEGIFKIAYTSSSAKGKDGRPFTYSLSYYFWFLSKFDFKDYDKTNFKKCCERQIRKTRTCWNHGGKSSTAVSFEKV